MTKLYDVIIVGGGPAGLSVGSELSKELDILILEKDTVGKTTRSWFDPLDVIEKNPEITPYTYGGVRRFLTSTYSGTPLAWEAKLFERYPYIKERELLLFWKDLILQNNSSILENCAYLDHKVYEDRVVVETLQGQFAGKLLIDASGSDSLILKKYELTDPNYYWWSVYGCIGTHPEGIRDMRVGDYMLWQTFEDTNADESASLRHGRPVFEYEILDENTSFTLILYLRKDRMPLEHMAQAFDHIIRKEDSTKDFHDIEIVEYKYGWYPSGGLTQRIAQHRVDFIGDAGCWTTPCGWGTGFILNNYKQYARSLSKLVKEDQLDKESLHTLVEMEAYDKAQILLNQIITHFLSNATVQQLDKFIDIFKEMDPIVCEKMFTLKISAQELGEFMRIVANKFDGDELAALLPAEDYKYLFRLAKYSTLNFLKEFFNRVANRQTPSRVGAGFEIAG